MVLSQTVGISVTNSKETICIEFETKSDELSNLFPNQF